MDQDAKQSKPDFRAGLPEQNLRDGQLVAGQVDGEDAILIRSGDKVFAVGAYCTHYHGALADGLVVGDTVRCPLHHACFSLGSGEALRAPALDPIPCWRVERAANTIFVREKIAEPAGKKKAPTNTKNVPASVVIVGGAPLSSTPITASSFCSIPGFPFSTFGTSRSALRTETRMILMRCSWQPALIP